MRDRADAVAREVRPHAVSAALHLGMRGRGRDERENDGADEPDETQTMHGFLPNKEP